MQKVRHKTNKIHTVKFPAGDCLSVRLAIPRLFGISHPRPTFFEKNHENI